MTQRTPIVLKMIELRFLVGALGERLGWWPSRFTDEIAIRRLATPFPRTALRAALESVTAVARRDHDAKLRPDSIHLFRLSATQEDTIAHYLAHGKTRLTAPPPAPEVILRALDEIGPPDSSSPPVGPCLLGKALRTRLNAAVSDLARAYASSARAGQRAIPYFELVE
jgi:hypothetical protein